MKHETPFSIRGPPPSSFDMRLHHFAFVLSTCLVAAPAFSDAPPKADCPHLPASTVEMSGVMLHVNGVDFAERAPGWSPYQVLAFSVRSQFADFGATTSFAPPQRPLPWLLQRIPPAKGQFAWDSDAYAGLDSAPKLKRLFEIDKTLSALSNRPKQFSYLPVDVIGLVSAAWAFQFAHKDLLIAVSDSGRTTKPLGMGQPILDVELFKYGENSPFWKCSLPAEAAHVRVTQYIRSDKREVADGFTIARSLVEILQDSRYISNRKRQVPLLSEPY